MKEGDFLELFGDTPAPDLIFYDPFSPKTDGELWTAETFARIFHHCGSKAAELFTYSASTAVRVALLKAGFFVARGFSTGKKGETTVALTRRAAEHDLLGEEWLDRWSRSQAQFPPDLAPEARPAFASAILEHPQFVL